MPPVSQCSTRVSTAPCQVKKNGAARQPTWTTTSQSTLGQFESPDSARLGRGQPVLGTKRARLIGTRAFSTVMVGLEVRRTGR